MARLLSRLGAFSHRRRLPVILVWLVVLLGGGAGALTLAGETTNSFSIPGQESTVALERSDPLANQIEHFAAVIRGEAEPICSGRDGLTTLQVVDAVIESARTGRPVDLIAGR